MNRSRSVIACCWLLAVCADSAIGAGCAQAPAQPTSIGSATQGAVAPSPSPTPDPGCRCTSVTARFDPGGDKPAWGAYLVSGNSKWRVGFRIDVTCTGTGPSNKCTITQIENGTLSWAVAGQNGQIIGQAKRVTKFHKIKLGDSWEKQYSDALGGDYPVNTTEKMSLTLDMEFEIKCESPEGEPKSTKFSVQGTAEAQATTKGTKPAVTGTITFTQLQ